MATIGETSILPNAGSQVDGYLSGFRFQAGSSFTAQTMLAYCRSSLADATAVYGIYSDNAGAPNALLGQTDQLTISQGGSGEEQWFCATLQSGISIVNSTWYWLAIHSNQPGIGQVLLRRDSSGGTFKWRDLGSYSDTLPATFGTVDGTISQPASIYASSDAACPSNRLIDVELSETDVWPVSLAETDVWPVTIAEADQWIVSLSTTSRT